MRYDTPVFFQRVLPGEYDSKTGNYAADQVTEVQKMASVMDTRAEIMQIVYGGIRQGSVTVQLQNHYQKPFDPGSGKTSAWRIQKRLEAC